MPPWTVVAAPVMCCRVAPPGRCRARAIHVAKSSLTYGANPCDTLLWLSHWFAIPRWRGRRIDQGWCRPTFSPTVEWSSDSGHRRRMASSCPAIGWDGSRRCRWRKAPTASGPSRSSQWSRTFTRTASWSTGSAPVIPRAAATSPPRAGIPRAVSSFRPRAREPGTRRTSPRERCITNDSFRSVRAACARSSSTRRPATAIGSRQYPTLILLPGVPGDENDWTSGGGYAEIVFDNLISDGRMVPMVVVMHDSDVRGKWRSGQCRSGGVRESARGRTGSRDQGTVSSKSEPMSWADAGLSLGGEFALNAGLKHPELFRAIASSAARWCRIRSRVALAERSPNRTRSRGSTD